MPLHLKASPSSIAPLVLLVGDPARAERIGAMLGASEQYNANRGLLGFTGTWQGVRLSVQTTGMGGPSTAIVVEELADLGATTLIRLGTCGGVGEGVNVLDLVIATGAVPLDGATRQYVKGDPFAPVATFEVTRALVDAASALTRPAHTGLMISEDAFYRQPDDWETWARRGALAVEMEAATLFTVALHRRLRAGAACLVVDRVGERQSWASDADIATATSDLIALGLAAVVRLASE
ncbi:MAG: purine-nucleoside phosphorylase [Dehalococcoidia bacterium]|nr:purine-nucleoside phosphorylase [Dehalococcoidia bacterium]